MSFFKIFFGNHDHAALVIHDHYLEALQLKGSGDDLTLAGLNRLPLEEGIVSKGSILRESAFQEVLERLFKEAEPDPISLNRLYINIPFEQIYPFMKVFSKYSKEDYMKMTLHEMVASEAPFKPEELALEYRQKSNDQINYSALAYPKIWQSMVREACRELGASDLHFVAEPYAQLGLSMAYITGQFALFSWQEGTVYLSFFYDDLLYDSFALKTKLNKGDKNSDPLFEEYQQASNAFETEFDEPIEHFYFTGFPASLRKLLKQKVKKDQWSATFLSEEETPISDLFSVNNYSPTLIGLATRALRD